MRDRTRQRAVAEAKSHRATPEELREAAKRVKEIEQELRQQELLPETKRGEDRESRYNRLLRLRSMRDDFTSARPLEQPNQPNSYLLSLVMIVASFLLCTFCAGGAIFGSQLINQKPNPVDTASAFWDDMSTQAYSDAQSRLLSPTLRFQYTTQQFTDQATQADTDFGVVKGATQSGQATITADHASIKYIVTRGTGTARKTYPVVLSLSLHAGAWGVDDMGAAINPTAGGLVAPTPTPAPAPTATP